MSIGMNAISRHYEYEADRFAVELQDQLREPSMRDMGERLGRALVALHVKNLSTVWVDWLYVSFSFLALGCQWSLCLISFFFCSRYSAYHHSHPTLTERLKGLEAFQARREKKAM